MITVHFAIGRLMLQYIEELGTTTFLTAGLLVCYGIFVFFLMRRMHYSWTEYGFTLANWRPCLAAALLQSAIFIALVTLLKWVLLKHKFFGPVVDCPLPPIHPAVGASDRGDLCLLLLHPGDDFSRRYSEFAYPFPHRTLREDEGSSNDNAHRLCRASAFEKPGFAVTRYRAEYFLVLALLQVPLAARRNRLTYDYWRLGAFYLGRARGIGDD